MFTTIWQPTDTTSYNAAIQMLTVVYYYMSTDWHELIQCCYTNVNRCLLLYVNRLTRNNLIQSWHNHLCSSLNKYVRGTTACCLYRCTIWFSDLSQGQLYLKEYMFFKLLCVTVYLVECSSSTLSTWSSWSSCKSNSKFHVHYFCILPLVCYCACYTQCPLKASNQG